MGDPRTPGGAGPLCGYSRAVLVVVLVVLAVFLGALTRATFGFGEALVAMPLLALLPIGLPTAAALMGIVSLTLAVAGVVGSTHDVDRGALLRLCIGAVPGVPLGVALLLLVPARLVGLVLGCALVGYGWYALTSHGRGRVSAAWAWPVGVVSGGLGAAYGFHGVPVVVFGTRRGWSPAMFRATMHMFFLVSGVLVVAGQGLGGFWTERLGLLVLVSLPAVAVAAVAGRVLHGRMTAERFLRSVYLLVAALGLVLVARSALG